MSVFNPVVKPIHLLALLFVSACAQPGEAGDDCTSDEDCAEGLECHVHDDHDGDDDDHGDEDHEDEGHEDEEGVTGACEEHEDHE